MKAKLVMITLAFMMFLSLTTSAQTTLTPYQKKVAQVTMKYYKLLSGSPMDTYHWLQLTSCDTENMEKMAGLALLAYAYKHTPAQSRVMSKRLDAELRAAKKLKNATDRKREAQMQKKDDNRIYEEVSDPPSFPGGQDSLKHYLSENVNYPKVARENGTQGKVVVSFVVETDGSLSNVKVTQSVDPSLDNETLRVIKEMPKWLPGKQDGVLVRVHLTLPIIFNL